MWSWGLVLFRVSVCCVFVFRDFSIAGFRVSGVSGFRWCLRSRFVFGFGIVVFGL